MKLYGYCAIAAFAAIALAGDSAMAQTAPEPAGSAYSGSVPWSFRDPNDRLVRLTAASTMVANRQRDAAGWGSAGGWGGAGGPSASPNAINNYFNVTNNVSCSSSGGVGSPVTCTGGTNDIRDITQTTTDSTADADATFTGNTFTNTGNSVTGSPVNNGPQ